MEIIPIQLTAIEPGVPETFGSILVKLHTDDGIVGIGEAAAHPFYLGDTRESIVKMLAYIWDVIRGQDPTNITELNRRMDALTTNVSCKAPNCAVDVALHDIVGKTRGEPVHKILGGKYRTEFGMLAHAFTRGTQEEQIDYVRDLVKRGYKGIEVKCAGRLYFEGLKPAIVHEQISKLRTILEAVPEDIQIVADFNQAYVHPKTVINIISKFKGVPNLWVEQPIHFQNLIGMAEIVRAVDVPIIADESALSPEYISTIVRLGAADMILVKITRLGGIQKAMKVIAIAEAAGLGFRFDTTPYSKVGDTTTSHVAVQVRQPFPMSVDGHTWFKENPVRGGVELDKGIARVPNKPGLGLELIEEEINKIRFEIKPSLELSLTSPVNLPKVWFGMELELERPH